MDRDRLREMITRELEEVRKVWEEGFFDRLREEAPERYQAVLEAERSLVEAVEHGDERALREALREYRQRLLDAARFLKSGEQSLF